MDAQKGHGENMLQWALDLFHGAGYFLTLAGAVGVSALIALYVPKPFRPWAWGAVGVIGAIIWGQLLWGDIRAKYIAEGVTQCEAKHLSDTTKANQKIIKRKREIRHETQNLDRAGIVRELCDRGWVRNAGGCSSN